MNKCFVFAFAVIATALTYGSPASACGGFWDFPCNAGKAIEKAAQDTGKTLEKATQDTGKTLEKAGQDVGKTVEAIGKNPVEILPVCWFSPQECRDDGKKKSISVPVAAPVYYASFRVDCVDVTTGAPRADSDVTVSSPVSRDAAVAEINRLYATTDLCQGNGDTTRRMVAGSGRFID
jgi:hypothetical protein